ncbi:hypothetical protein OGAPHI_004093 [Ogataea philodendri]|uniref:FHA domain-containing protein n=1 Tax=Ogataea philodendri TaxID=1378263 RepID=A0A9P8P6K8_9ASCO|nr:uncharacterized protein OGAPHI_004093 [Ogataea philodendri]KAH3665904.1 hypothetical protein OGAPHI_004093 [Ogataea philodendri]
MTSITGKASSGTQNSEMQAYQRRRSTSKTQSNYNSVNNQGLLHESSLAGSLDEPEPDRKPPSLQKFAHVVKLISPDQSPSEFVKILNVPLAPDSLKIGRQNVPKVTNKITDGFFDSRVLSRNHAELFINENKLYIRDLKSSNGTFINDEKLDPHKEYELKMGDKLDLGTTLESQVAHKKITCKVVELSFMSLGEYETLINQTLSKGSLETKKLELFNSSLDALIFSDVIDEQENLVLESLMDELSKAEKPKPSQKQKEDQIVPNLSIQPSAKVDDVVRKLIISINNEYLQQQRLKEISRFMKSYSQYVPRTITHNQDDTNERIKALEADLASARAQLGIARSSEAAALEAFSQSKNDHSKAVGELEALKSKLGSVLDELEAERALKVQAQTEAYEVRAKLKEQTESQKELPRSLVEQSVEAEPVEPVPAVAPPKAAAATVHKTSHVPMVSITGILIMALAVAWVLRMYPELAEIPAISQLTSSFMH